MSAALTIHHPDAVGDPYPVDTAQDLADAIEAEASTVASEAGSDLLESPDQSHRDMLRDQIIAAATHALQHSGRYRDPFGIVWTLDESPEA